MIATKGALVAGDVTFSNFAQPYNSNSVPNTLIPVDGLGNVLASAVVNTDGTVSLRFTFVDPATGNPAPLSTQFYQSIGYDVTVTNPAFLLHSVNQDFGPGTTGGFNFLKYWEPGTAFRPSAGLGFTDSLDMLFFDNRISPVAAYANANTMRSGVLLDSTCETIIPNPPAAPFVVTLGGFAGCSSPLPGGNRQTVSLQNFFGVTTDNHGIIYIAGPDGSFQYTGIETKFTLVPSTTVDPLIPVALNDASLLRPGCCNPLVPQLYLVGEGSIAYVPYGFGLSLPGIGGVSLGLTTGFDGRLHPGFAPAGGTVVTFTTSNPLALPLPASITMPQGASNTQFDFADPQIDQPVDVNVTASAGGVTLSGKVNVAPAVPLAVTFFGAGVRAFPNVINSTVSAGIMFNRMNFAPTVVALTSSNMAVAPVPPAVTIPALTSPFIDTAAFVFPNVNVPVDTPVTFTATYNGTTYTSSVVIPGITDQVKITKAELVLKNGSLKVEATGNLPSSVLTLYNASTGALIGNMAFSGLSGTGAKFSFQGTVSPVTSLRLVSNFNGTSIGNVAQK